MGVAPCVHGDVCRAYMRRFGRQPADGGGWQECIISTRCPACSFYEAASGKRGGEEEPGGIGGAYRVTLLPRLQ